MAAAAASAVSLRVCSTNAQLSSSASLSLRGEQPLPCAATRVAVTAPSASPIVHVVCGRGDKRTAKGKRTRGSFGNSRPRSNKGRERLGLPLTPLPASGGSASRRKQLEDDSEYIHIDLEETSIALP